MRASPASRTNPASAMPSTISWWPPSVITDVMSEADSSQSPTATIHTSVIASSRHNSHRSLRVLAGKGARSSGSGALRNIALPPPGDKRVPQARLTGSGSGRRHNPENDRVEQGLESLSRRRDGAAQDGVEGAGSSTGRRMRRRPPDEQPCDVVCAWAGTALQQWQQGAYGTGRIQLVCDGDSVEPHARRPDPFKLCSLPPRHDRVARMIAQGVPLGRPEQPGSATVQGEDRCLTPLHDNRAGQLGPSAGQLCVEPGELDVPLLAACPPGKHDPAPSSQSLNEEQQAETRNCDSDDDDHQNQEGPE